MMLSLLALFMLLFVVSVVLCNFKHKGDERMWSR
jgi:hypothetical protein